MKLPRIAFCLLLVFIVAAAQAQEKNPARNAYFGETHVHTSWSFDALPKMFEAADTIGTLHFARFVVLGDTTLAFVSEYDGDLADYIMDFAKHLGAVFDTVFAHVIDPPPTPVAKNADALIEWVKAHNVEPLAFYSAYPSLSVLDIKAQTAVA